MDEQSVSYDSAEETITRRENNAGVSSNFTTVLIKNGIVKNETQAGYLLLGIAGAALLLAIFLFGRLMTSSAVARPQLQEDKPSVGTYH